MIELHKLTACNLPEAPAITSRRNVVASVHFETHPGSFFHVTLDEKGLIAARGEDQVFIPLHEIVTLVVNAQPRLALIQLVRETSDDPTPSRPRPTDDFRNA